jgi:hypothetical protein
MTNWKPVSIYAALAGLVAFPERKHCDDSDPSFFGLKKVFY